MDGHGGVAGEGVPPCLAGRQSASVLSVGGGTSDFNLAVMRMLLEKIHHISYHISYVALDPDQEHNPFQERPSAPSPAK